MYILLFVHCIEVVPISESPFREVHCNTCDLRLNGL